MAVVEGKGVTWVLVEDGAGAPVSVVGIPSALTVMKDPPGADEKGVSPIVSRENKPPLGLLSCSGRNVTRQVWDVDPESTGVSAGGEARTHSRSSIERSRLEAGSSELGVSDLGTESVDESFTPLWVCSEATVSGISPQQK